MIKQLLDRINVEVFEGLKSARTTYLDTGKIDSATFDWLVAADPTPQKKYLDWMCKQAVSGAFDSLTFTEVNTIVADFYEYSKKNLVDEKDIYKYGTVKEVEDAVKKAKSKTTKKQKKEKASRGAETSFETDRYIGYNIYSHEASKKYGEGAPWCTRSETNPSHWFGYRYNDRKSFIYILNKNKPTNKYALLYKYDDIQSCYNSADSDIGFSSAFNKMQAVDDSIPYNYTELFEKGIPESGELKDPADTAAFDEEALYTGVIRVVDKLIPKLVSSRKTGRSLEYIIKENTF